MSSSPTDRVYTDNHTWIQTNVNPAKVGVTKHCTDHLGTVTAVSLVAVNQDVTAGSNIGTITAGSNSNPFICPVNGHISDRNDKLLDLPGGQPPNPGLVSSNPFGTGTDGGWLVLITLSDTSALNSMMTAAQYDAKYPS